MDAGYKGAMKARADVHAWHMGMFNHFDHMTLMGSAPVNGERR